jgi:hypothetical protein
VDPAIPEYRLPDTGLDDRAGGAGGSDGGDQGSVKEGSASFLKKRSKKLLLIWAAGGVTDTV